MKLANFFLMTVLVGTLGVLGCSDDPPATGNGGNGGSGTAGSGGNGGGTGGDGGAGGGNASCGTEPAEVACCINLCVGDDAASQALFTSCVQLWNACELVPVNQDECRATALLQCSQV